VAREQRQLERWFDETFPYYILRWVQRRVGASAPLKAPSEGFPLGPMAQLGLIRSDGTLSPEWFDTSDGGPGPEFVRRLDDLAHMLGTRRFFYADHLSRADLSVAGSLSAMFRDVYPGARALLERAGRCSSTPSACWRPPEVRTRCDAAGSRSGGAAPGRRRGRAARRSRGGRNAASRICARSRGGSRSRSC
jgi:hypothetical protein